MAFCRYCGAILNDSGRFCPNCGKEDFYADNRVQRQQVFDGVVHKCPNCGEIITNSFLTRCPSCNYEIRGVDTSLSVKYFARQLQSIENTRPVKEKHGLMATLSGHPLPKTDQEKISLIESFPVPNTKAEIMEFVILAAPNIDETAFAGVTDGTNTALNMAIKLQTAKAWMSKFEQAYQKASILYPNDSETITIKEMYNAKKSAIKQAIRKEKLHRLFTFLSVFAIIIGFALFCVWISKIV